MKTVTGQIASWMVGVGLLASIGATAQAAITYVDAGDGAAGNTTLVNGAQWDALDAQGPGGDGLWDQRVFGNNGTIYQNSQSGNVDDAHRLATTITGLTPGTPYDVYVYFWSDVSQWRITAGLTNDTSLPLFSATGGHADPTTANTTRIAPAGTPDGTLLSSSLNPDPFTAPVMIAEGNRRLYQGYLGQGTADGTGQLLVYVDDAAPNQADQNQRTWYDGVGFEAVPEPGSMTLLGLTGLALLRRRRA